MGCWAYWAYGCLLGLLVGQARSVCVFSTDSNTCELDWMAPPRTAQATRCMEKEILVDSSVNPVEYAGLEYQCPTPAPTFCQTTSFVQLYNSLNITFSDCVPTSQVANYPFVVYMREFCSGSQDPQVSALFDILGDPKITLAEYLQASQDAYKLLDDQCKTAWDMSGGFTPAELNNWTADNNRCMKLSKGACEDAPPPPDAVAADSPPPNATDPLAVPPPANATDLPTVPLALPVAASPEAPVAAPQPAGFVISPVTATSPSAASGHVRRAAVDCLTAVAMLASLALLLL